MGVQGTLGSLGKSFLASNAHSHLVFGTVVWKLVCHPFLLCLVDSEVPEMEGTSYLGGEWRHKKSLGVHTPKPHLVLPLTLEGVACSGKDACQVP